MQPRTLVSILLVASTLAGGAAAEPRKAPKHVAPFAKPHQVETFPAVWITGLAVFGASWIATIGLAGGVVASEDRNHAIGHAFVPAAGPILMLDASYDLGQADLALPALCAAQAAGLVTAVLGLVTFRVTPVDDEASAYVAPTPGGGALTGRF